MPSNWLCIFVRSCFRLKHYKFEVWCLLAAGEILVIVSGLSTGRILKCHRTCFNLQTTQYQWMSLFEKYFGVQILPNWVPFKMRRHPLLVALPLVRWTDKKEFENEQKYFRLSELCWTSKSDWGWASRRIFSACCCLFGLVICVLCHDITASQNFEREYICSSL